MVDELLTQKNGYDINNIQNSQSSDQQLDYIRRDDSSMSRLSDSTSDGSINSLVSETHLLPTYNHFTVFVNVLERNDEADFNKNRVPAKEKGFDIGIL
jgi:hypothetical protein